MKKRVKLVANGYTARSLAPKLLDLFFGLYYYGISRQLNMDALEYSAGAFPRCLMAIAIYKGRNEIVAHPLKLERSEREHRSVRFFLFLVCRVPIQIRYSIKLRKPYL
jgi:hypothetical protein